MGVLPEESKFYRVGDTITINEQTTLTVVAIRDGEVVLGINTPPGIVPVYDPDTGERFDTCQ